MQSVRETAIRLLEAHRQAAQASEALAQAIAGALRPIIRDLEVTVGWAESENAICFWASGRSSPKGSRTIPLTRAVRKAFDEAGVPIPVDDPFGVYITPEETRLVERALRSLLEPAP